MKKSIAKFGLAMLGVLMLFVITSCNGKSEEKVFKGPKGISVKVKASKF